MILSALYNDRKKSCLWLTDLCSPEDCFWLWLTVPQPVWKSSLESLMTSTKVAEMAVTRFQQQSFSGLCQPRLSTNYKHWHTWVTTNNSPSQDYANLDDQSTTNIDLPGSQPTTVLLRTMSTGTINQPQTLTHLGHNEQQSFSGLCQPGRPTNHKHWLTWVTTNNSPSQDYAILDDQSTTNIASPGFIPFTELRKSDCGPYPSSVNVYNHLNHSCWPFELYSITTVSFTTKFGQECIKGFLYN